MTDTAEPDLADKLARAMWAADVKEPYDTADPLDQARFRFHAKDAIAALTALGAVMPDEAAKLRARVDELETTVSILKDSEPFSYDDCRDDCDGCHESLPMCDCHVPAAEARDRIRDLRDRVEAGEAELARVRAEVPTLRDAIEDEANGSFVTRPGPPLDLTAIRNAVNPKSAPKERP